jgi:hypothetical protein
MSCSSTARLNHATLVAVALLLFTACGPGEPRTDAERLARGKELVRQMSERLAAEKEITVTLQTVRDIVRKSGKKEPLSFMAEMTVRRPDRLHVTTKGPRQLEAWYDGRQLTIAGHADKVFAQAPMPETIDRTFDTLSERYGWAVPSNDLFYSSPEKALLSDTTAGGYAGREKLDGVACHHLAFQDIGVDWDLWLPVEGDLLPRRLKVLMKTRPGKPLVDITFLTWNLKPQTADATFVPKVPADYEGIAMLQRAAAVRDAASPPSDPVAAPSPR